MSLLNLWLMNMDIQDGQDEKNLNILPIDVE
jgi:hypothetical protein